MNDVGAVTEPTCRWCGGPITGRKKRTQTFCSKSCAAYFARLGGSHHSPWTPELQARLLDLWPQMSAGKIAKLLGVTKNAVIGRLYRQDHLKSCEDTMYRPILRDRDFVGCRFIEGEPTPLRPGMFCCAPTVEGASYCAHHFALSYYRVTDDARRTLSAGHD